MGAAPDLGNLQLRTLTPAHLCEFTGQGRWKFFKHLRIIQDFFWRLETGEIKRGMIFMPPQHGKSEYVSGGVVQWKLGQDPSIRCALASYAARISKKWGRRARDFFQNHGKELFGLELDPSKRAADYWGFDGHQGGMVTCGVGGSLTGEPVDFGVIDDPFKDAEQAKSASQREKVWDWYNTVWLTRLSARAKVLIINTRWHPDDLCGRLLALDAEGQGEGWEVLNLAALCPGEDEIPEEDHPEFFPDRLGRQQGEALCPELHSAEKIGKVRETQGESWFWAMFQGRPTPGKGDLIREEYFRYYELGELPCVKDPKTASWYYPDCSWVFDDCIQSWDTKYSKKTTKSGSWVCGQVWGRKGANKYLLYEVRGRWGVEETINQVRALSAMWPIAKVKLFEPKASGPEIVARLQSELTGMLPWPVAGDKETRMRAQEHHYIGSNVWLPSPGLYGWMRPHRMELCQFPNGIYNDRVDAASQALHYFDSRSGGGIPLRQDKKSVKDDL